MSGGGGGAAHTTHPKADTDNTHTRGVGQADPSLIGRDDLPRDEHGSGLVELVLAFALEEGVGAVLLGPGGVEHLCFPVAHLQLGVG